ncbi:hypothetical protein D9619_006708 [Psilocybe cf. subviscida]|uniref:Uncharacterized protein n=1 Tax=Psilocybe cf. subviscida TaxID=2480587 RepID=A0A8H5B4A8_9AGAR|nr:hypothetical protein D9619_006708 [Psilocybe cf. subviscida]
MLGQATMSQQQKQPQKSPVRAVAIPRRLDRRLALHAPQGTSWNVQNVLPGLSTIYKGRQGAATAQRAGTTTNRAIQIVRDVRISIPTRAPEWVVPADALLNQGSGKYPQHVLSLQAVLVRRPIPTHPRALSLGGEWHTLPCAGAPDRRPVLFMDTTGGQMATTIGRRKATNASISRPISNLVVAASRIR